MQCDMCGIEAPLVRAKIEGTMLNVCKRCGSFGEIIKTQGVTKKGFFRREKASAPIESIVENYSTIIKNKRESKKLKQEDFASQINEKESIIHKIETGHFTPSIDLARKIERFLGITLIEELREEEARVVVAKETKSKGFTLGDMIKFKK